MKNKNLSYQYIAGFVDGEGHISVIRRKKEGRSNINYEPIVMITNTNKIVLELIKNKIGFGRWVKSVNISSYSKRPFLYRIIITGADAIQSFLRKVIPYLIVKRELAELVLKFVSLRLKNRRSWKKTNGDVGSSPPYSEEDIETYLKLEKLMPRGHKIT